MTNFETLKNTATTAKEALSQPSTNQQALESKFVEAMKQWEDALVLREKAATIDPSLVAETESARKVFEQFKSDLGEELNTLLTTKEKEEESVIDTTTDATTEVLDTITQDSITRLSTEHQKNYTNRASMVNTMEDFQWYINSIQTIIIILWASNWLDHDSVDKLWPITRAGVKTIQNYLNWQGVTREQLGCKNQKADGIPGPLTLAALFEQDDNGKSRLENMLADKKNNTLSLTLVEPEKATPVWREGGKWTTIIDAVTGEPFIAQTPAELERKAYQTKLLESIKKIPGLEKTTTLTSIWIKFDKNGVINFWSSGLQFDTKDTQKSTIILKDGYKVEQWKIVKIEEVKKDILAENITEKQRVDNNILKVTHEEISTHLMNHLHKAGMTFTWPNKSFYEKEYKKVLNISNPKINITLEWNKYRLNILRNWWRTDYYIDIKPHQYITKNNKTNFTSLIETIKEDIIKKVDNSIEQKKNEELQQKYNTLQSYLENTIFPLKSLYKKEEQTKEVQAFFKNFPSWIEFDRWDSNFLKEEKNKEAIQVVFDNTWTNKYGTGKIFLNGKFDANSNINKTAIKNAIRSIVDQKIKLTYKSYQETASKKVEEAQTLKKDDTTPSTTNTNTGGA